MRVRLELAGLLAAAAVLLAVGAMGLSAVQRLAAQEARIEQQMDRLEAALHRLEALADPSLAAAGTPDSADSGRLHLATPREPIHAAAAPRAHSGPTLGPGTRLRGASTAQAAPGPSAPKAAFEAESGSSEWGKATSAEIGQVYESDPFFARYNGRLETECRITACRMSWAVPRDPADPELALAAYELMALAPQQGPSARRMQSVRRSEEGRAVIEVYFSR